MQFERLGKNVTQLRGISYKPNDISAIPQTDYVPVLKANNIQEDGIDTNDLIYIHKSKVKPEQFIKKGDLLLAASSGSKEIVGKNIYFESDFEGSFGAFCKLVRPKKNINPRYLATFFKSVPYKRHIRKLLSGALINNLKNEYIDSLLIPNISDSDQIYIANLLSKAEDLIAQRKESIRLLDEFLKSAFLEMFGDIERMKNMESEILSDYIDFLTSGSRGWAKYYSKSGSKFLRIQNVWKGSLRKEELQYVDAPKTQEAIRTRVKEGDLLITITADLGRTAVVPKNFGEAYINQHIALVRLKNSINPTYAAYYFFMPFGYSAIQKKNKSAVKSGLTFNDIKTLPIIVPPIELQTQFVQIVEKIEALKTQYQQSLQELDNLYGSLSQKAFSGELGLKDDGLLMAAELEVKYKKNR